MGRIPNCPEICQTGKVSCAFVEGKPGCASLLVDATDDVWHPALALEAEGCGLASDDFVAVEGNDEGKLGPILHGVLDEESDAHF